MIFNFLSTHVGRSLLEGLQRGNWLSGHLLSYFYFHADSGYKGLVIFKSSVVVVVYSVRRERVGQLSEPLHVLG